MEDKSNNEQKEEQNTQILSSFQQFCQQLKNEMNFDSFDFHKFGKLSISEIKKELSSLGDIVNKEEYNKSSSNKKIEFDIFYHYYLDERKAFLNFINKKKNPNYIIIAIKNYECIEMETIKSIVDLINNIQNNDEKYRIILITSSYLHKIYTTNELNINFGPLNHKYLNKLINCTFLKCINLEIINSFKTEEIGTLVYLYDSFIHNFKDEINNVKKLYKEKLNNFLKYIIDNIDEEVKYISSIGKVDLLYLNYIVLKNNIDSKKDSDAFYTLINTFNIDHLNDISIKKLTKLLEIEPFVKNIDTFSWVILHLENGKSLRNQVLLTKSLLENKSSFNFKEKEEEVFRSLRKLFEKLSDKVIIENSESVYILIKIGFFNFIKEVFSNKVKLIKEIFPKILNKWLPDNTVGLLVNLIDDTCKNNYDWILEINEPKVLKIIINYLSAHPTNKIDLISPNPKGPFEQNLQLSLLEHFNNHQCFDKHCPPSQNYNCEQIIEKIYLIKKNVEELNITMKDLDFILDEKNKNDFINLICFNDESEYEIIISNLIDNHEYLKKVTKEVEVVYKYEAFFLKPRRTELENLKNEIITTPINQIYNLYESTINYCLLKYNDAKEINHYLDSLIFQSLIKDERNNNQKEEVYKEYIKRYKNLDLANVNFYNTLTDTPLFIKIFSNFTDESRYKEEIEKMCKFRKIQISETETEKIEEIFKMIKNIVSGINLKKSIIEIFNVFYDIRGERCDSYFEGFLYDDLPKELKEIKELVKLLPKDENNNFINLIEIEEKLRLLKNDISFLKYINAQSEEKFKVLIDMLDDDEVDEGIINKLQANDIFNCINVISFVHEIKRISEKINCKTILITLRDLIRKKQFENIISNIGKSKLIQQSVEELIANLNKFNKTKQKITKFFDGAKIEIVKNSLFTYVWEISMLDQQGKKNKEISFNQLLEYNDIIKFAHKKNQEEIFYQFLRLMENLIKLQNKIDIIKSRGGTFFNFSLEIKDRNQEITYNKQKKESFKQLLDELDQLATRISNSYIKGYGENKLSSFLFGNQFNMIYHYLRNGNKDDDENKFHVKDLLQYLTNGKFDNSKLKPSENVEGTIENIMAEVNRCFELIDLSSETIFKNNLIINEAICRSPLYTFFFDLENKNFLESKILNLYINYTKNLPLPQTVLICNESTKNEEIESFIYRASYCRTQTLFTLANIECLTQSQNQLLLKLINDLYSKGKKKLSVLIIGYYQENLELISKISASSGVLERANIINKLNKTNVTVVKSEISGSGKSFQIMKMIKNSNRQYYYFPISGIYTRKCLMDRLYQINARDDLSIHIDLTDINKPNEYQLDLLRDFLFSILILKCFHFEEYYFYIGNEIPIYVEIPNGFYDFYNNFGFLADFPTIDIKKKYFLEEFESSQVLTSSEQILCNYLFLKNDDALGTSDLYLEGISKEKKEGSEQHIGRVYNQKKCISFLKKEEIEINNEKIKLFKEDLNFYQIKSIINILGENLRLFTLDDYLSATNLNAPPLREGQCRIDFFESLEELTQYLINHNNYLKLRAQQIAAQDQISQELKPHQKDEDSDIETILYEQIKKEVIFINDDGLSLTFIPKKNNEKDKVYQRLKHLYNLRNIIRNKKEKDIKDIDELPPHKILKKLKIVLNNDRSLTKQNAYVFTADNFIKGIYLLLRVRANIPSIMVGETGCGKTSLIKVLADLKDEKMKILNIHSGTTNQDIIDFFEKDPELKPIENNGEKQIQNNKKIWVFFDEINTCDSIGLISEIMCKRTLLGKRLKDNLLFFGACNPYKRIPNQIIKEGLKMKEDLGQPKLVYLVKPLPESLLNFVFYFGSLKENQEKEYIKSILSNEIKTELDEKRGKELLFTTVEAISKSHEFLRSHNQVYSVSLRDIRRFCRFYNWFVYYLDIKQKFCNESPGNNSSSETALLLSFYMSYYIRLSNSEEKRNEYMKQLEVVFRFSDPNYCANVIREEQKFLSEEMLKNKSNKGISKNKALLSNMFCIFTCINMKIPLIICGKPGSSKSLSATIVFNAMGGINSDNPFFKLFPNIYVKSYQGSLNSTSEGIKKVFDNARDYASIESKSKNIIPVVYFDELGLAEKAPTSPLKILHYELENDEDIGYEFKKENMQKNKTEKIGFIGISNWSVDASKMNRAVFLSIPDLDDEIENTGEEIKKSYKKDGSVEFNKLIKKLCQSYKEFKQFIKNTKDDELYGSRDFYHMIKLACRLNMDTIEEIGVYSIERNFGGSAKSLQKWKELYNINLNYHGVKDCINENIGDKDSRYLMIFVNPLHSQFLINEVLASENNKNMYIGSKFEKDINDEKYLFNELTKIQMSLEKDILLILKDLDKIYPSFYDLFNQNFTEISGKQYCRIAMGNRKISLAEVNKLFKCIILIDKAEKNTLDPPFLNRFEKQILSFTDLISKELIPHATKIFNILSTIPYYLFSNKKVTPKINLEFQMLNLNNEEILGILYVLSKKDDIINKSYDEIETQVLSVIVPTFSQDIVAFISISGFKKTYPNMYEKICQIYSKECDKNIYDIIKTYKDSQKNKFIIYTFSNIFDEIAIYESLLEKGKPKKLISHTILLSSIKRANELEKEIDAFLKQDKKYCIVKISQQELIHLPLLNQIIEKNEQNSKKFVFVVYLKREFKNAENLPTISRINNDLIQYFIDDLFSEKRGYFISCIVNLLNQNLEKSQNGYQIDIQTLLENVWGKVSFGICLLKLNLHVYNVSLETQKTYLLDLSSKMEQNQILITSLKKYIIEKEKGRNYILSIFKENIFENNEIDFFSVIEKYFSHIILCHKINISIQLVVENSLEMLFELKDNQLIIALWQKYLNTIELHLDNNIDNFRVDILSGMKIPSSFKILNSFLNQIQYLIEQYSENHTKQRKEKKEYSVEKLKSTFIEKEKSIIEKGTKILKKFKLIEFINTDELYKMLFEDYLLLFCYRKFEKRTETEINQTKITINFLLLISSFYLDYSNYSLQNIVELIFWIESYSSFFEILITYVLLLNDNSISLLDTIIQTKYQYSAETEPYRAVVNGKLFKIINFLIEISLTQNFTIEERNFVKYINLVVEINQRAKSFYFIEIVDIEYFIYFKEEFEVNRPEISKYDQIHNLYTEWRELIEDQKLNSKYLSKNHPDVTDPSAIIEVLTIRYKKKKANMKTIIGEILNKKDLISMSSQFFYALLSEFEGVVPEKYTPGDDKENLINNFGKFLSKCDGIKKLIEPISENGLDEVILFIFDCKIQHFFQEIENEKNNFSGIALDYLKKSINYINNYIHNKEKPDNSGVTFDILYYISYMKLYLLFLLKTITIQRSMKNSEISNLFKGNSSCCLILRYYFLKIISKIDKFETINWKTLGFEWINDYTKGYKAQQIIIIMKIDKEQEYNNVLDNIITKKLPIDGFDGSQLYPLYDRLAYIYLNNYNDIENKIKNFPVKNKEIEQLFNLIVKEKAENKLALLFAGKLCMFCLLSKKSFYNKFIKSENESQFGKIPGRPEQLLIRKTKSKEIADEMKKKYQAQEKKRKPLYYYCSCGVYYEVGDCGFPEETEKCKNCEKIIGGKEHLIHDREGHYIVYLDEKQKENYKPFSEYPINEKHSLTITDLEKLDDETQYFDEFHSDDKVDSFKFYFLNFIYYSCEYYKTKNEKCLGFISNIWKKMNKILKKEYVHPVLFLSFFLGKIQDLFDEFNDVEKKEEFEENIKKLFNETQKNYQKYLAHRKAIIKNYFDKSDFFKIVNEIEDNNFKISSEIKDIYKYFYFTPYPSIEDINTYFESNENLQSEYPIIYRCVNEKKRKEMEEIKIINNMNPFVNYMIDKYSFQINREEATEQELSEEIKKKKIYKKFSDSWEKLKDKTIYFGCKVLSPKNIINEKSLIYYLNDNKEECGLYIAGAYQRIGNIQNEILNSVPKKYLESKFIDNNQIIIQEVNEHELINFDDFHKNSSFKSLNELLEYYSHRYITKEGEKSITYNFKKIEEEIITILLVGKKLLNTENQKFITFIGEMYSGTTSSFISEYEMKYPQTKPKDKNYKLSSQYISTYINFLQNFILYIIKKKYPSDTPIQTILSELPDYIIKTQDIDNLFKDNPKVNLENLLNLYNHIEKLTIETIIKKRSLIKEYKKELSKEQKNALFNYFIRNANKFSVPIESFLQAINFFIIRVLNNSSRTFQENDFNIYLEEDAFWDQDLTNKKYFDEERKAMLEKFSIKTSQTLSLYDYIQKHEMNV